VDRRKGEADLYFQPQSVSPPPPPATPKPSSEGRILAADIVKYYTGLPTQQKALLQAVSYFLKFAEPYEVEGFTQTWRNIQQHSSESVPTRGSIDWHNAGQKISAYFTVGEVTQGDPRRIPTDPTVITNILAVAKRLDELRDAWGKLRLGTSGALGVTSWYRPEAVNREVGGVSNSAHIQGYAADVYPINSQPGDTEVREFQSYCEKYWRGGVGRGAYKGFVHLDLGENRRWDY
jgi:putative chitinase